MKTSFKIGTISGIPVKLHISLIIIVGLIAWSVGANLYQIAEFLGVSPPPVSPGTESYLLGGVIAVGLFVSVLAHELAHSIMAQKLGIKIEEITLWIFGGVSNLEEMPREPGREIKISIVGPGASLLLGVLLYLGSLYITWDTLVFTLIYLGYINLFLAAFNLLPAFPMDGGRLLRALLATKMPYARATSVAARIGKGFAVFMGISGIFLNPFLIVIAIFIYFAANAESQNVTVRFVLEKLNVEDIMSTELNTVTPDTSVRELMKKIYDVQHTGFPVVHQDRLVGLVTMSDLKKIPESEMDQKRVAHIMTREVRTVEPCDDVSEVWNNMLRNGVGRFPVMDDGELVGMVTRSDVMQAHKILSELRQFEEPPYVDR